MRIPGNSNLSFFLQFFPPFPHLVWSPLQIHNFPFCLVKKYLPVFFILFSRFHFSFHFSSHTFSRKIWALVFFFLFFLTSFLCFTLMFFFPSVFPFFVFRFSFYFFFFFKSSILKFWFDWYCCLVNVHILREKKTRLPHGTSL